MSVINTIILYPFSLKSFNFQYYLIMGNDPSEDFIKQATLDFRGGGGDLRVLTVYQGLLPPPPPLHYLGCPAKNSLKCWLDFIL
jgi:hypothetical protein